MKYKRLASYEDLLEDPVGELDRMLRFLGLHLPADAIAAAAEKNCFAAWRAREQLVKRAGGAVFFRKGRVGGGTEELEPALLGEIEEVTETSESASRFGPALPRRHQRCLKI